MKKYIIVALLCLLMPLMLQAGSLHQGMRETTQYKVLMEYNTDKLNTEVNDLLAQGWALDGRPAMKSDGDVIWVCQSMTKTTWVKQ